MSTPPTSDADQSWCDGIAHAARQLDGLPASDALAYHVAAARELFEEAGVLLARHPDGDFVSLAGSGDHERLKQDRARVHEAQISLRTVIERERLRLALDALVLFAHWVTPPIDTRQFDTRFFMTRVPPHQTPAHDDTETTHSLWVRPADAIAQSVKGEIVLPPPTWSTLRELEPFESVDAALGVGKSPHRHPPHAESHRAGRASDAAAAGRPAASGSRRRRSAARNPLRAGRSPLARRTPAHVESADEDDRDRGAAAGGAGVRAGAGQRDGGRADQGGGIPALGGDGHAELAFGSARPPVLWPIVRNEAVRPIFDAWLRPFHYLGAATLTTLNTGGTDHMPFDAIGLPGFQFIQDPLNYESKVHHSNLDVYEEALPDDLKQAAAILATFVYQACMRDEMLPRKPLPKPHTDAK